MNVPDGTGTSSPQRGVRTRPLGIAIRVGLLLAWLGLYGHHASEYLLLSLGLVERRDVSTIITAHNDYRYRYDLLADGPEPIGRLFLEYDFVDGFWETSLVMDLDDVVDLPGMAPVLAQFELDADRSVHLECTTLLDDRFRLTGVEARGSAFGVHAEFVGEVDHRGLTGTFTIPAMGVGHRVHNPGFVSERAGVAGVDLALALPPDLVPGDRFRTDVISLDPNPAAASRGFVTRRSVVYEVVGTVTRAGAPELNRVQLLQGGQAVGELLADRHGVIHRTAHPSTPVHMELRTIFHNGRKIWPEDEAVGIPDPVGEDDDQAVE